MHVGFAFVVGPSPTVCLVLKNSVHPQKLEFDYCTESKAQALAGVKSNLGNMTPPSRRGWLRVETNDFALGQEFDPSSSAIPSRRLQGNAGAQNCFEKPPSTSVWMPIRLLDSDSTEKKKMKLRQKTQRKTSSKSRHDEQGKQSSRKIPRSNSSTSRGSRKKKRFSDSRSSVGKERSTTQKELPKKENRRSDSNHRQSSSTSRRTFFSKNVQAVIDQRIVEKRRNYESERQRRQQRRAEETTYRLERKRNLSVKTKEAVLKAMMSNTTSPSEPDLPELPKTFLYNLNSKTRLSTMENSEMYEKVVPFSSTSSLAVSAPSAAPEGSSLQSTRNRSNVSIYKKTAWFQKAMTKFGKQIGQGANDIHETSSAQQQRWLNEVYMSISEAHVPEYFYAEKPARSTTEILALKEFGLSPREPRPTTPVMLGPETEEADEYTVCKPPRVAVSSHSTNDESISSMVLLFNWLSCNPVPDQKMKVNHRGKLVLVESFESSNSILSENSMDKNQQQRYKLICSP